MKRWWLGLLIILWITGVSSGLWVVWAYENRPGLEANAPHRWPSQSTLKAASDRPTLLFLAHPQCTCTDASIQELTEVLARTKTHPKTYIVFLLPSSFNAEWEHSALWKTASALPDVTVLTDNDGVEAQRFGVYTSGETLLYDRSGSLIFSGGITGSRGHAGENDGEHALLTALTSGVPARSASNVFGCPLFAWAE